MSYGICIALPPALDCGEKMENDPLGHSSYVQKLGVSTGQVVQTAR
ncbi:hypothetical protein [Pasteuria penetrans]|nr:hypothetical protein [Pasteuria penetrans]